MAAATVEPSAAGAGHHRPADGVLGPDLGRRRPGQHVVAPDGIGERHLPHREGAGLVEHDGVDALGPLEDLAPLDEHAQARAPAGADHDRHRRGQAEGARAGHDEHGDGGEEAVNRTMSRERPGQERDRGHGQDDRHEDARHPVGQPLHRRLRPLGLGHQADDPGQGGVGADGGGPHREHPLAVDGGACHPVARPLVDGNGLAGEHRLVHRRRPVDHHPVDRHLLPGTDADEVAHPHPGHRHPVLAVGMGRVEEGCVVRAERDQPGDGPGGPTLGPSLQPPAEDEEGHDEGGHVEVEVAAEEVVGARHLGRVAGGVVAGVGEEESRHRQAEGGQGADGDEGVHVGGAGPGADEGAAEERVAGPELDGDGEDGGRPPGPVGAGPPVGEGEHDQGEGPGDDGPAAPSGLLRIVAGGVGDGLGGVGGGHRLQAVADAGHRLRQSVDIDSGGVEVDGCPAGGEVHPRRLDALLPPEDPLDPGRARPTGHSGDVELDVDGGRGWRGRGWRGRVRRGRVRRGRVRRGRVRRGRVRRGRVRRGRSWRCRGGGASGRDRGQWQASGAASATGAPTASSRTGPVVIRSKRRACISSSTISVVRPDLHRRGDARLEVVAEHRAAGRLQRPLHRRQLLHHVDAVGVVLDHADDGVDVAAGAAQPVDQSLLVSFPHGARVPHLGRGEKGMTMVSDTQVRTYSVPAISCGHCQVRHRGRGRRRARRRLGPRRHRRPHRPGRRRRSGRSHPIRHRRRRLRRCRRRPPWK